MANITIKMKNGSVRNFMHTGRPGGNWTKKVIYEGAMVIIEDEYNKRTAIPLSDVAEVIEIPYCG